MNFTALLFLACLTGAAQAIRGLKTGKSKKGPSINGIIADATCSNEVSTTGGSASGTLTIAFNNPNPAVFMDVAPGDGVVEDVEAARFAYVFDGDTSTHNTAVVIDGEAYIVTATGFEGVADDSLAMSWTQTGDQTSAPMVSSSAGVLCTLLMDAIPSPTPTPCTVGDNAADPSTINCQNNGVATGTANNCACDCTGTRYSGPTCTQCTAESPPPCVAFTSITLKAAVNLYTAADTKDGAIATYGLIGTWYTGEVTSMAELFYKKGSFNEDISGWDVSNVNTMKYMFEEAYAFNQPIGSWDVSKVTNMYSMFFKASAFNQPIDSWDVSKVTNMMYMFFYAYAFNQPIGSWVVSSVTNMGFMFYFARNFSQNLSTWCVENVIDYIDFNTGSGLTTAQLPIWGSCPA